MSWFRGPLALALSAFGAFPAAAQSPPPAPAAPPAPAPASLGDLQSPEQADTRYSAYSLPRGVWGLDVGALGSGGGDAYAKLGLSRGFGSGIEASVNLAHAGVGLFNLTGSWHFVDTRYFDLGFRAGVWYGHGEWFWTAERLTERVVSQLDVVNVPLSLTGSVPITRGVQLDLVMQYSYAQMFGSGSSTRERSPFSDAEFDLEQFFFRPVARWFISDNTALGISAKLPLSSRVALKNSAPELSFSETWSLEGGLRSRFSRVFYGNIRLHYGEPVNVLYGAYIYPSFELEMRF